ncbi:unnamed protein product [Bursaphelenchus xylophilus]|uniref:(pine wood nematode) hypothetical protein n=1 Tax=Bursaphelenchus xylophilus TaxID=6326 RepID=A0A1I7SQ46_BURXY|nr:unnamed protein product [Bursaphelenchus xylophilus]CAG9109594.1 unnamed protein product [Bursaphelenchus xylophilus]
MVKVQQNPEEKPKKKRKKKKKTKTMDEMIGKLAASKIAKIRIRRHRKHRKSHRNISGLSKLLLRARLREKMLQNIKNDNKLTAQYRQIIRQRKTESIRQNLQLLIPLTRDLSDVKHRIVSKTRNDINVEVQNTVNLIDDVYDSVNRINVSMKNSDLDMLKPAEDGQTAKEWIAKLFLLFKSFDFKELGDKTKFLPELEDAMENRKKDDAKLEEIKTEEQRLLGQKKSLLMEIEDNEIRMIAKEQILKERMADQKKLISGLKRQIHDVQRRLGYLPSGFTSLMPTPLLTPARSRSSSLRRRSSRISVQSGQSEQKTGRSRSHSNVLQSNAASRRQSTVPQKRGSVISSRQGKGHTNQSRRSSKQIIKDVNDPKNDDEIIGDIDVTRDDQERPTDDTTSVEVVEAPPKSKESSRRSSHSSVPENDKTAA